MTGTPSETERVANADEAVFTPAAWGLFASISLIWGSSFLFISIALEAIEPGLITWARVALGAAVLNVLPRARVRIDRADWPRLLGLSVVWVAVPFTLFPLAEQHINSAVTGMLNGSTPIFAAIAAGTIARRLPGRTRITGLAIGMAGVVSISLGQGGEGDNAWLGIVMVLGASACYGVAANLAVPLQQRYGSLPLMARMLALAALWTLPGGVVSVGDSTWEGGPAVSVVVIGALGTGLAFVIMGTLVGKVGATRASLITYLIPVVALCLGVAFKDDQVTGLAVAGVTLVIAGAVLASRGERAMPDPIRPRS
ncbi:DMT family transporter [Actinospongicola halichondriae]|uniref:DMT family transporter n=1 Tax=Actinospongicola halichondriae TaxID=3236844 RepID=UPI003D4F62F4